MIINKKDGDRVEMKIKSIFAILLILLIGIVSATTLSFSPSSFQIGLGDEVEVNITIIDVIDLYSFQLNINYDPTIISYVDESMSPGPFLTSDGENILEIDPDTSTPGLIKDYAITRYGTLNGINGGGFLAKMRFVGLTEGTSNLDFLNDFLYDSNEIGPQPIVHDSQSGNVVSLDCDIDRDTYYSIVCGGSDCNDNDEDEFPGQTWYKDFDGDLYSDGITLTQCTRPTNYYIVTELTQTFGDCNDNVGTINPEASEVCDGIDNDCANGIDDTFSAEDCSFVCESLDINFNYDGGRPFPYKCCGNNPELFEDSPYQSPETSCYDGQDNDCDTFIDIFDSDCSGECNDAGENDYWASGQGDCNQCDYNDDNDGDQPGDWSIYPGIADQCDSDCGTVSTTVQVGNYEPTEISCDGIDNDCDGLIDEGVQIIWYKDTDNDGFGNPSVTQDACSQPAGYVLDNTDCNDNDEDEFPGQTWYKDFDGDLYSDGITLTQCTRPTNYYIVTELTQTFGDCNDNVGTINPEASEVCDGIDNDCANGIDDTFSAEDCSFVCETLGYNFDLSRSSPLTCCGNDGQEANPFEIPELSCTGGFDNDCDGVADIFDSDCSGECNDAGENDYWASGQGDCNQCDYNDDNDGDQPGDWSIYPGIADQCDSDCGTVSTTVQVGNYEPTEISCDGIDNDCDGLIDEGVQIIWYRDNDNDGYGNNAVTQDACSQPAGYVLDNTDCNDNDEDEFPGQTWYKDFDGDLYSDGITLTQCTRPTNYYIVTELTQTFGDCNDNVGTINPEASEVCDGIDNDCANGIDDTFSAEDCSFVCESMTYNYNPLRIGSYKCCGNDAGEDDPFQITEQDCSDGSDNDCDGYIDMVDSDCVLLQYDLNGDGYVNVGDMSIVAMSFGSSGCVSPSWCNGRDFNRDGNVNIVDLSLVGLNFRG